MFLQCFWDSLIMCDYFRGCQPSVQSCDVCYVSLKSAWYVYIVFSGCLYNSGIDSSRVYQLHGLQGWGNLLVASVCFLGEPQDLYYFDDIVIAKGNSRYLKMPTIECLPIFIEMSRVNLWAQFLPMSHFLNPQCFSAWKNRDEPSDVNACKSHGGSLEIPIRCQYRMGFFTVPP